MQSKIKLKIATKHSERYDCGSCKYMSSNGFIAPGGWCSKHPEFNKDICMDRVSFPKYATICDDIELRNFY